MGCEVQAGQGVGVVYREGVDTAVIGRSTSVFLSECLLALYVLDSGVLHCAECWTS